MGILPSTGPVTVFVGPKKNCKKMAKKGKRKERKKENFRLVPVWDMVRTYFGLLIYSCHVKYPQLSWPTESQMESLTTSAVDFVDDTNSLSSPNFINQESGDYTSAVPNISSFAS